VSGAADQLRLVAFTPPTPATSAHPYALACGVRVLTVFPSPPVGVNEEWWGSEQNPPTTLHSPSSPDPP
jgi:hypothetical protein